MSNYNDAQQLLQQLKPIINQCIENHPSVRSAIKAKKATVDSVNTSNRTVTVRFPFDNTLVTLPYNPQVENYLTEGSVKGKNVSVWFYQSISNGIVMQDDKWSESIEDGGVINGGLILKGPLLSRSGDNPIYILPYIPYSEIDPTHETLSYLKALLRWICINNPDVKGGTWIGRINPNIQGLAIINIYDTNRVDPDGIPEYSTGTFRNLDNEIVAFGTNSYKFISRYI